MAEEGSVLLCATEARLPGLAVQSVTVTLKRNGNTLIDRQVGHRDTDQGALCVGLSKDDVLEFTCTLQNDNSADGGAQVEENLPKENFMVLGEIILHKIFFCQMRLNFFFES